MSTVLHCYTHLAEVSKIRATRGSKYKRLVPEKTKFKCSNRTPPTPPPQREKLPSHLLRMLIVFFGGWHLKGNTHIKEAKEAE
jgi:hypothetical protein